MKSPFSRLFVFLVAAILFITQAHAQVVEIPDPNLRGAITDKLELPDNTPITQQEMLKLTKLVANRKNITDLTGLKYATNLEVLNLVNNRFTDISSLANLTNLTHLYLTSNALETIEPLAGLIHLRVLDLYNTGVKDITPLANLTALESLVIVRNMIVDISPLVGLKNLKRLRLAENPIRDFSPLLELEGVELDLEIDLGRLDQLHLVVEVPDPNLRQAIREALSLPDGVPLTQLEMLHLQHLDAWNRNIKDLSGLEHATNLEFLRLWSNQIQDLTPLANLTKLELLALWGNQIQDITPLANLTKLRELDLAYNAVESVEPIAGLINLQRLNLTINRVQDITPLANLINLEFLYIRENLVTDITPIHGLNLIDFEYDEICDFPPIAPPVRERIQNRTFPSIFAWGGSHKTLGLDHLTPAQRAALHDLDLGVWFKVNWDQTPTEPYEKITTSLAGDLSRSRETHQKHLDLNPNLISLLTVNHITHLNDEAFPPDTDFWVRDANGEIARRPTGSPIINFLKPEVQDLIAKRIIAVARCGLYDGVHLDQWGDGINLGLDEPLFPVPDEEIIQARRNILRAVREQVREDFLIVVNGGLKKNPHYADYINGSFMETGRDTPFGYSRNELKKIESTLLWSEKNLREPRTNCLEGTGIPTEPPDGPTNRRMMRIHTTLSLTHSDGYVMYTTGEGSVIICPECPYPWGPGHRHIWHPFWDAGLGYPVGPKAQQYQNIEGLFIREFTNGWAVYNRSEKAQTITLPASAAPVSDRGDNAASPTHLLPDLDGEIYLKGPSPADVNDDGEVNILDLVQVANGLGEATPDPNGDGVVNILDLVFVAQQLSQ